MIKCSNDNCPILWYHPGCVGLGNVNPKILEDIQFTCDDCQVFKNMVYSDLKKILGIIML